MTFKEFKNLKVHDIIYSFDIDLEDVIEYKIESIDYFKREFYCDGWFYNKMSIKDFYNDKNKCKSDWLLKTIRYYSMSISDNEQQIQYLQKQIQKDKNELSKLYEKHSEFMEENVEYFI